MLVSAYIPLHEVDTFPAFECSHTGHGYGVLMDLQEPVCN